MLTWESSKIVGYEGGVAVELRRGHCLSTDTKPTGPSIGNGSYLREMDTGDEYAYDAQNDIWRAGSGGGGGSGLPAVTSDDNGDVLTVVDGAWDKAAPSGGSEIFEVVFEAVYDDGIVVTSNHTAAEILAAKNAGKYVTSKALFWGAEPYVQEFGHTLEENSIAFYYNYVCVDNWGTPSSSDYLSTAQISWSDSGWVCFGGPYALTPSE